MNNLTNTIFLQ